MKKGHRLLLIDDDSDFVSATRTVLESAGYTVDFAYTPKEGLKALRSARYDLLLLDIHMGRGAEGVLLARSLRRDPALKDLPVLIVTGIKEQLTVLFRGQYLRPHLLRVDELIEKPVNPEDLLARVARLIKKKTESTEASQ
ncbi:MAG: response regulator [bacterium JZ-2024 1]